MGAVVCGDGGECVCAFIYYICTHITRMSTRPYTLPCTYVRKHVYVICTCKDEGEGGVVDECEWVVYANVCARRRLITKTYTYVTYMYVLII